MGLNLKALFVINKKKVTKKTYKFKIIIESNSMYKIFLLMFILYAEKYFMK